MERTHSFGYWLRRRRKALDLTQAELAQRVSCSLDLIQKIEADARRPSRQLAEKLAGSLGLDATERVVFVQAARAERAVDQLPLPAQRAEPPAIALPQGTITFLFTDIEGSTQLWERYPRAMPAALARHNALLKEIVSAHSGVVFKTVGDSVLAAFAQAPDALAAASAAQHAISTAAWELPEPPRVRMALHTGSVESRNGDYFGPALNRVARLLAAGHSGQVLLSLATEQLVREHLPSDTTLRDLGMHRLKDLSLPEEIFQLLAPDLPAMFPALNTLDARHTNLPAQPTQLLGREQEVAAVSALLRRPAVRLVSLTGPGGVGKTRLGVQVAAELLDNFPDGVYLVDLAPIREPNLVTSAIAGTLRVRESGGQPLLAALKDYLRDKRMLLLLDNFEHLLDAASSVAELLGAAAQLKVLVTSREILHLRGEKEILVQPLALPDAAHLSALEQLSQYAAVALFIERALDARPEFVVTNATAPAVAEICVRLDGLPLALELAAARVKLFEPEALLARLGLRLPFLTGGPRDLPARQRTLRNTIAWSYELLTAAEQALFRRLGVFVGGCTIEAATAVCHADSNLPLEVMNGLASLVDKSLLRQLAKVDGEPWFMMLETIHEYALERLEASGEAAVIHRLHAEYYLALAEAADPHFRGTEQVFWLNRLEREHDNLRAAVGWTVESEETEVGLRLIASIWQFWEIHGYWSEGRAWLDRVLAQGSTSEHTLARAKALLGAGVLALKQGDSTVARTLLQECGGIFAHVENKPGLAVSLRYLAETNKDSATTRSLYEQSLAIYRESGDKRDLGLALAMLGDIAWAQNDYTRAGSWYADGLSLFRELRDKRNIAQMLHNLGDVALLQSDYASARIRYEESLPLFRELGDKVGIADTLGNLGDVALAQGDYQSARTHCTERLEISRELGHKRGMAIALGELGNVARCERDYGRTAALYKESLAIWRGLDDTLSIAETLNGIGELAFTQDDIAQAAALYQESQAMFQACGATQGIAWVQHNLGRVAHAQGEDLRAAALFTDSLALFSERKDMHGIIACLDGLAGVSRTQRQSVRAARLFGAAEALRQVAGEPLLPPAYRAAYERDIAAARTQLDGATFAAAWAAGQAMTLEQAIADALDTAAAARKLAS